MKLFRAAIISAAFVAVGALSYADPAPKIHYAPAENLEHVDVALIDSAQREVDLAAYVLTDWPVIQALTRAADRGVKVCIYPALLVYTFETDTCDVRSPSNVEKAE
jgi:phosphatidylserine/phosphatidylglycerophosphate/cardiolipin synthase-like enzyme